MADENTVGREPVQIVELIQPKCGNIHGTAPCMSTQTGDNKCFNTRATCRDPSNYRGSPAGHLASDLSLSEGDSIASGDLTRTAALFAKFDVDFSDDPNGVIYEQGSSTTGAYLGVTGGNLVFRAGDGGAGTPANTAKVTVAIGDLAEKNVELYCAINTTAKSVSLWSYDKVTRVVSLVGTDTAVGTFTDWADTGAGGIGYANGTVPTGESGADFDGKVHSADFYDSTPVPDMDATFALNLFFSRGNVAERGIDGAPYIIPLLESVSTRPASINLAGADENASGLGTRASISIGMGDAPYNDLVVDPYLSDRTYAPLQRGSFWTKWMPRNKYRVGMTCNAYEGYAGQALADMRKRQYFVTETSGPNRSGVTFTAKDVLSKVKYQSAQIPAASTGELYADIDDTVTSIEVTGAALSDYEDAGTIRIGDEFITYSSVATSTNGITFTVTARGSDDTTAAEHSAEDSVQACIRYTDDRADVIVRDLLSRAGVSFSHMDYTAWQDEFDSYMPDYLLTTILSVPTGADELLAELQEQCLFNIWWDEYAAKIKWKVVRSATDVPPILSQEEHILADSFSIVENPTQRASQVWMSYNPKNWIDGFEDADNFNTTYISADLSSEGSDEYGEPSIRKIYSRWIPLKLLAFSTTSRILKRYVDVPREATLSVDAKDRDSFSVGDAFRISHYLDVTDTGERNLATWTITSMEETKYGRTVQYMLSDTTSYGLTYVTQASGAADYDPTQTYTNEAFIGNADGLLSDGTESARIS